ncbi:MAG: tol-pal system protein YbgF [Candidatus Pelagibacter sp.]|tara:strand:- start:65 stop:1060 length:996 start_codon:yes stop_codon:yes gene_type:complete
MRLNLKKPLIFITILFFSTFNYLLADTTDIKEVLNIIQKDLRTLERAVYSESFSNSSKVSSNQDSLGTDSEDVLTRHLLKLSEIEKQFQDLTNRYEEINFKLDKLSSRLSKIQADTQLRFQQLENNSNLVINDSNSQTLTESKTKEKKILPGSNQPQDLGSISYEDMTDKSETQVIQSVDTTQTVITEVFQTEEKILPNVTPKEQYEFATSFLKVGDYNMAERAFKEFVDNNPNNKLSGNAQYWYAETFRIRQLYTDAASAYLEGYQKYPKSEKAPINLLKLGVSLVQIGEKDQGCLMIAGVKKQYPNATQSVLQKAKYEEKKFECQKENS